MPWPRSLLLLLCMVAMAVPAGVHGALVPPASLDLPVDERPQASPPSRTTDEDNFHEPQIAFVCPSGPYRPAGPGQTVEFDTVVHQCPIRIYDFGNPFGSPSLAMDADTPVNVSFVALHGEMVQGGNTDRSRQGQTHTTFTSSDQGVNWEDEPFDQENTLPTTPAFGEFADLVYDGSGYRHLAFLWSLLPADDGRSGGALLGLYKTAPRSLLDATADAAYAWGAYHQVPEGEVVERVHLVRLSVEDPHNDTTYDEGRPRITPRAEFSAVEREDVGERIVAMWFSARDNSSGAERTGSIQAAWARTDEDNVWVRMHQHEQIGPCSDASNPVVHEGLVYVACVVAKGYTHREGARVGDVDMWSFDPATGGSEIVETTGVRAGHPILAATPDGYMVLMTTTFNDDTGTFEAGLGYGWYGRHWTNIAGDVGGLLHRMTGSRPLRDAHITALEVTEDDKLAFLIFKEWQNATASNGTPVDHTPDDFQKTMFALNECDFVVAAARMRLGAGIDPYHSDEILANPQSFNDIQDGLHVMRDPETGDEMLYFAVNDWGSVQYGAVDTRAAATFCAPAPPFPAVIAQAVPQALSTGTQTQMIVGSVMGVLASAMVAYLLLAKRRNALALATEDDR